VPGFEVAGRVAALGPETAGPAPGTPVLAVTRFGGYASRVVVPAHQVFHTVPGTKRTYSTIARPEDAGFAVTGLTAYYALFELAHPRPGARVLVHSAAGGVGGTMVRLAKLAGCTVAGTVGRAMKVEAAFANGADAVYPIDRPEHWARPDTFDVVCDALGGATLRRSYRALAPAGKLVVYGFASLLPRGRGGRAWGLLAGTLRTPRFHPLRLVHDNKSVLAFNLSYLFPRRDLLAEGMARLLAWRAEGRLPPPRTTVYPAAEAAAAHRDLESGATTGKLVLAFG
jgi:NADPH:quinone reductase-like Zn-dependent oxidoreductase